MQGIGHYVKRPACMGHSVAGGGTSTAQAKFGTSSLFCNGAISVQVDDSRLIAPQNSGSTGDFTVEFWFYATSAPSNAMFSIDQGGINMGWNGGGATNHGFFVARAHVGYQLTVPSASAPLVLNSWQSLAVTRASGTMYLFLNGNVIGTAANTTNFVQSVYNHINFGSDDTGGGQFYGYIDEFRISNIARYTSAYTPATAPFQNDAYTQVLLHFDDYTTQGPYYISDDNA